MYSPVARARRRRAALRPELGQVVEGALVRGWGWVARGSAWAAELLETSRVAPAALDGPLRRGRGLVALRHLGLLQRVCRAPTSWVLPSFGRRCCAQA